MRFIVVLLLLVLGVVAPASGASLYHFDWTSEKLVREFVDVGGGVIEPVFVGGPLSGHTTATYVAPAGGEWGSVAWTYAGVTYRIDVDPEGLGGFGDVPVHPAVAGSTGFIVPAFHYTGPLASPSTFSFAGGWGSMGESLTFSARGVRTVSAPEPSVVGFVALAFLAARAIGRSRPGQRE
jgi:hypothetical protein